MSRVPFADLIKRELGIKGYSLMTLDGNSAKYDFGEDCSLVFSLHKGLESEIFPTFYVGDECGVPQYYCLDRLFFDDDGIFLSRDSAFLGENEVLNLKKSYSDFPGYLNENFTPLDKHYHTPSTTKNGVVTIGSTFYMSDGGNLFSCCAPRKKIR